MTPEEIQLHAQANAAIAALAHKHVSVSYLLIAALGLVMVLMGLGGYAALKSFDAQLARAEQREAMYDASVQTFKDTLAKDAAVRDAKDAEIAALQARVAARDAKPLPLAVQAGLKPGATALEAAKAVSEAYGSVPAFGEPQATPDGNVALSVPQAQAVAIAGVERDRYKADVADLNQALGDQKSNNLSLSNNLKACQDLNVQANGTIDAYKKAAKKSRFKKFLAGAEGMRPKAGRPVCPAP